LRLPPSVATCLRLSDRRHSMLGRHRIVSARREHIVIVSSSVYDIPLEALSRIVS